MVTAKPAKTVKITDKRATELSGLAASAKYPGIGYTMNDEPGSVLTVELDTGKVVGDFSVKGHVLDDVEALAVRGDGTLAIAVTGDNKENRKDRALIFLPEPGPGKHGALKGEFYPIAYEDGPHNVEAFAFHPVTQNRYMASKDENGHLYRSDVGTLFQNKKNVIKRVGTGLPPYISDFCFTNGGRNILLRQKGVHDKSLVLEWPTWKPVEELDTPYTVQGESITLDPVDGHGFYIGSEGKGSPLHYVPLDERYW